MSGQPVPTDAAGLAAALSARLRAAGVATDVRAATACAAALPAALAADDPVRLYWTLRVTLLRDHRDLGELDRVLGEVLGRTVAPAGVPTARSKPRGDGGPGALPWATRGQPSVAGGGDDRSARRSVPVPVPAAGSTTGRTPFDDLDPGALDQLADRLRERARRGPRRRTRRRTVGRRGPVDLRRTAQQWRRTGGEPIGLVRARRRLRPRRLVVVCDVSESMQPYAAAYLHLMRAASVEGGETFAFATTVTRLTPVLGRLAPEAAITEASARVVDRFGGTRIATSLAALLRSHHGELLRGAVCVIASDGWDTDPPAALAAQMARLARRAHSVVWLNPRAGEPGYQPLAGGMAAALPYVDALLPAARLDDLPAVIDALTGVSSRGSRRRRGGTS